MTAEANRPFHRPFRTLCITRKDYWRSYIGVLAGSRNRHDMNSQMGLAARVTRLVCLSDSICEESEMPIPSTALEIDVPCPNCGTKTRKTLVWLRENDEFLCPKCGTTIDGCGQLVTEFERTTGIR